MTMKSTGSTTISFGLVSIPIKLYSATVSNTPKFSTLHQKCGGRVKQKIVCPVCDVDVCTDESCKGFEVAKGQYVQFTAGELKAMQPVKFEHLSIEEFVPVSTIDPIHFEKSVYVGPDKGGDRAFNLLSKAMVSAGMVAVGQYMSRNKVYICAIRPYKTGLIIQHLYYEDEVRDFEDVPLGADCHFDPAELDMAASLVKSLTVKAFNPGRYTDAFRANVAQAVSDKQSGKEVAFAPTPSAQPQMVDLFSALKASLVDQKATKKSKKVTKKKVAKKVAKRRRSA